MTIRILIWLMAFSVGTPWWLPACLRYAVLVSRFLQWDLQMNRDGAAACGAMLSVFLMIGGFALLAGVIYRDLSRKGGADASS